MSNIVLWKSLAARVSPNLRRRLASVRGSLALELAAVLLFAAVGGGIACAQSAPDSSILRRVDDHYNHLRTLRARYSEHYTGMGVDRTETGTLLLRKPGRMRWSYDQPAGKIFVLDGRYAWFYTPGDGQVSRTSAKDLDDLRSPLRLLLGHTQLSKELADVVTTPVGDASKPAGYHITGVPKGMENRVRLITLEVTPDGAIQKMKIEETDGATTEFAFSDQQENVPTAASDFVFAPPPNIPVIDAQAPL